MIETTKRSIGVLEPVKLIDSLDQPYRSLYTVDFHQGGEILGNATLCFASDHFQGALPERLANFVTGEVFRMICCSEFVLSYLISAFVCPDCGYVTRRCAVAISRRESSKNNTYKKPFSCPSFVSAYRKMSVHVRASRTIKDSPELRL
jgi:hypothetical protein